MKVTATVGTPFFLLLVIYISSIAYAFYPSTLCRDRNSVGQLLKKPLLLDQSRTEHRSSDSTKLHGIPKLFRWLTELYPSVLTTVPLGLKNNMDTDYFYLDMNGIIHACTHANVDQLITLTQEQMFERIFLFTDRLYKMVCPTKLIYLAVDGVAPRAKMNQQRSRRFRSSQDRETLIAQLLTIGEKPPGNSFDSNCITPGTQFMHDLGIAMNKWIQSKFRTDPFWKRSTAKVVFSGPDVPGEGEHKAMEMIRGIKAQENKFGRSQKNSRHCIYGLDADLIMLSLVSHEPNFVLLREKVLHSNNKQKLDALKLKIADFETVNIRSLRELIKDHFRNIVFSRNLAKTAMFDIERIIDDFVFMCFFVGNDFLPTLPHLDIADGTLSFMMNKYHEIMPLLGGYMIDKDRIHLPRVELFIQEIARREKMYFQHRSVEEETEDVDPETYRDRYYQTKFGIEPGDEASIRTIVEAYVHGLVWVLNYYHVGCKSWTWYYPYLYAPLASDIKNIGNITLSFESGPPFTPLLQLLSVLPPQSGKFLPQPYEEVMNDPSGPLKEFYPLSFDVDINGKHNDWESIVKIPFINATVLLNAVSKIDHSNRLTENEKKRNCFGTIHTYSATKKSGTHDFEHVRRPGNTHVPFGRKQFTTPADLEDRYDSSLHDHYYRKYAGAGTSSSLRRELRMPSSPPPGRSYRTSPSQRNGLEYQSNFYPKSKDIRSPTYTRSTTRNSIRGTSSTAGTRSIGNSRSINRNNAYTSESRRILERGPNSSPRKTRHNLQLTPIEDNDQDISRTSPHSS